jgi:hypothetical protein
MPTFFTPVGGDPRTFTAMFAVTASDSLPVIRGGAGPSEHGFSLFEDRMDPKKRWYLPKLTLGDGEKFSFIARGDVLANLVIPVRVETCPPVEGQVITEIPLPALAATLVVTQLDQKQATIRARSLTRKSRAVPAGSPIEELIVEFDVEPPLIREVHAAVAFKHSAVLQLQTLYPCWVQTAPSRRGVVRPRMALAGARAPAPGPHAGAAGPRARLVGLRAGLLGVRAAVEPMEFRPVEVDIPPTYTRTEFMFQERISVGFDCNSFGDHYQIDRGQGPSPMGCEIPPMRNAPNETWDEMTTLSPGVSAVAKIFRSSLTGAARVVPRFFAMAPPRADRPPASAFFPLDTEHPERCAASFDFEIAPLLSESDWTHIRDEVKSAPRIVPVLEPAGEAALIWDDPSCPKAAARAVPGGFHVQISGVDIEKVPVLLERLKRGQVTGQLRLQVDKDRVDIVSFTLGGNDISGRPVSMETVELNLNRVVRSVVVQTGMNLVDRRIRLITVDIELIAGSGHYVATIELSPEEATDSASLSLQFSDAASPPIFSYAVRASFEDGHEAVRGPFEQRVWGTITLLHHLFDT